MSSQLNRSQTTPIPVDLIPPSRGSMAPPPTIPHSNHQSVSPAIGALRKQNVACDACRAKKVRCQRTSTLEKCEQCAVKGSECTSHYIEQLQAKQKKGRKSKGPGNDEREKKRRKSSVDLDEDEDDDEDTYSRARPISTYIEGESSHSARANLMRDASQVYPQRPGQVHLQSDSPYRSQPGEDLSRTSSRSIPPLSQSASAIYRSPAQKQAHLIRYLFSPYPVTHHDWGFDDTSSIQISRLGQADLWEEQEGRVWSEEPTEAHLALQDEDMQDLLDDLMDTFFAIANPRFAMLDQALMRAQTQNPNTHPNGPVYLPYLALALSFGAKFSDHHTINADRRECTARDRGDWPGRPRSRLVQLLCIRTREVAEAHKVQRVPCLENVQTAFMLQLLVSQAPYLGDRFYPQYWLAAARHCSVLGCDRPEGLTYISDSKERSALQAAWWALCTTDGFISVVYRYPPCVHRHSVGLKEPTTLPPHNDATVDDPGKDVAISIASASAGSVVCRKLYDNLFSYLSMTNGIRLSAIRDFVAEISAWRDDYLSKMGVPSKLPESWDFIPAIMAATADAYYHTLWLVVDRAIRDFGVADLRGPGGDQPLLRIEVDNLKRTIREEAEHGALRIAALTGLLLENEYLRLDPSLLPHTMCEAGRFLAAQGREEYLACVLGIRQYSIAFPQFWAVANELEETYAAARYQRDSTITPASMHSSRSSGNLPRLGELGSPALSGMNHTYGRQSHGRGSSGISDPPPEQNISLALFEWLHQT